MKKILILFILIALPLALSAQLSGSGTFASPYSGTFQGDLQWNSTNFTNGKVFVGGDVTIDNEELIIGAGMKIIFVAEGADLIINGTGQLTADGTSGSKITFTADDDDDGTYGETGERWGHIYFNAPNESNQSKINYCIIEYGDVHTFSDYQGYGGAIHSNFSNLIISNSILRNNYGKWGGAIFVNSSKNPTIRNCYIYNNKSDHGGGGVYCWNSSSSLIENCIFDSNQCLETSVSYYTGGGLAAQISCSIKVINCTFVNNTSTQTEGQGLLLHNSSSSLVINSIFWGSSDKQIYGYNTSAGVVINCAYRGITFSSGTPVSSVVLNSSNSASDGPNFTATDGSDWSIKFVSPCRDAGVNSYTGVTIPTSDYIGNPTIGTKDIGAYEVQYSRWTGATSDNWLTATNWEYSIFPVNGTSDVIIPSGITTNYPTVLPAKNFTIGSGKIMILNPGAKATLGTLINNGTLKLESDASNIASLIVTTYNDNGNEEIELYLTGGGSPDYKWHYISTPVSTLPVSTFTGVTYDIAGYFEARVTIDLLEGWIGYDGWVYASENPAYDYDYDFTDLVPGRGYDYYDAADNKFTFSGTLNTSDVSATVTFKTGGDANLNGFNLLGNPFSSGLDWDYIIAQPGFPASTSKSIYFTRDNSLCSYVGQVGSPGDVTGIIPPMQGFFTKTYDADHTIVLSTAARTHNNIHARYKKGASIIPLIRLSITENSKSDETVVRFDESAKSNLDNDFDAVKMFASTDNLLIYSALSGTKYVINGQPFPEKFVEIPIVVNLKQEGNHTITTTQLQGLDNYDVYLIDNSTGFNANLKTDPVLTFSASPGLITDRFILKVVNVLTGTEDPIVTSKSFFNIYQATNMINIQTVSDEWDGKRGSVRVLDLTGRTIIDQRNTEFSRNSIVQVPGTGLKGMYVVEIRAGALRYVGKVVIR